MSQTNQFLHHLLYLVNHLIARPILMIGGRLGLKNRYFLSRGRWVRLRYACLIVISMSIGVGLSATRQGIESGHFEAATGLANVAPLAGIDIMAGLEDILHDHTAPSLADQHSAHAELSLNKTVQVSSGDTLSTLLEGQGVGQAMAMKIVEEISEYFDPKKIRIGQEIDFIFASLAQGGRAVQELSFTIDPVKSIHVRLQNDEIATNLIEKPVERVVRAREALVDVSLYGSAAEACIPDTITANAIRIFSWNTDFQRDIRPKDKLEVLYESFETEDGTVIKTGDILYARLVTSSKDIPLYRFETKEGKTDYFMPDGISIRRTLMKTPIDGARMSSGFGMRRHPVLGYNKMHKGVDFAASKGTPIYAAGDGVIEKAGWNGGFGKYVRIRHNGKLKTAYAHMSSIKVKNGTRVKQGEVIGYVGSTGRSTGPHLHYEVHVNGKAVNPRSVNLPTGTELAGSELKKFKTAMNRLHQQFAANLEGTKLASATLLDKTNP
jgi:murein DD-endopeptidase MepM/ murein hydrolase activator NlpD